MDEHLGAAVIDSRDWHLEPDVEPRRQPLGERSVSALRHQVAAAALRVRGDPRQRDSIRRPGRDQRSHDPEEPEPDQLGHVPVELAVG